MSSNYHSAVTLFRQGRADLAERALRRDLEINPQSSAAHSFLGICLARLRRLGEAVAEAEEGLRIDPGSAFSHFAMACVLVRMRSAESQRYVEKAISLDPTLPHQFFLLSAIHSDHRRHQESLNQALQGLRMDPNHSGCASLRALALQRLGRKREAEEAILHALSRGPNDDFTHAAQGWRLLAKNSRKGARAAFLEALRIDPENRWAQLGLRATRQLATLRWISAISLGQCLLFAFFVNSSNLSMEARSNMNGILFLIGCLCTFGFVWKPR